MSDKVWYVAEGGQSVGPMSLDELKEGMARGNYTAQTMVFKQGMDGWKAAGQVPELGGTPAAAAPPPPAPSFGAARGADEVDFKIFGEDMQYVEVELDPGESVVAEAGAMMYMEDGIEMETIFGDGSASTKGGIMDALMGAGKRLLTGESLFMTLFGHRGSGKRHVAFAAPYPGTILPMNLGEMGGTLICQKDAFLCAAKGVSIGIAFQKKIGVGLFGGEGFIMQKLEGDGFAFVHAGGTLVQKELGTGETIRVDTGCIVALMPSVSYDIQFVGGVKSAIFGGEGFFFATLTGPGHVWLQSLPFSRMAGRIWAAAPQAGGKDKGEGSILGKMGGIGGFFDGN